MPNSKQMKIVWHMYYFKISHMDKKELTRTIKRMKSVYGEDMRVLRGKNHNQWAWNSIYLFQGEVKVTVVNYLQNIIADFPKEIMTISPTPAGYHRFNILSDK